MPRFPTVPDPQTILVVLSAGARRGRLRRPAPPSAVSALSAALTVLAATVSSIAAQTASPQDPKTKAEAIPAPEVKATPAAKVWITKHEIKMGRAVLAYTSTAGTMLISNDKESRSPSSASPRM